jgi:hypothetical protein
MRAVWPYALLSALIVACLGEQELRDDCATGGASCPSCQSDAECVIVSNPCHATAVCTHARRDPPIAVNQIGCNREYDVPEPSRCGCVAGVCRAR